MSYALFFFLLLFVPAAFGQALPKGPGWPSSTSGGTTTYSGGSVNAANSSSWSFPNASNGSVYGQSSGSLGLPGGRSVPITGRAPLSPAAYSKAIARAAARILPGVSTAAAIWDLLDDLGYSKDEEGFKRADPTICTVAPCYEYQNQYVAGTGWYSTYTQAAEQFLGRPWYGQTICAVVVAGPESANLFYGQTCSNIYGAPALSRRLGTPSTSNKVSATEQELADAIAAQSGWPAGSKIGDAIKEAIEHGETIPVPAPSEITGPASAPGPSTTSSTTHRDAQGNPTGVTTSVTNVTYNISYGPNTVTVISNSTTTTTNPDGTTDTKTDSEPEEEGAATDTPLGALPKLYERKYPDGLNGVWQQKKAALTSSPLLSLVSGLMPSIGFTGTCPVLMVNLDVGFQNFGSHDFAPPCWVWDFGKVVVIVSALLLARALIFGG